MSFGKPFFLAPDGTPRSESALGVRFLFTGREWLAPVGLYDYRHRADSPTLGRFLQVDPITFASGDFNLYHYCANKPLNFADAFGLCMEERNRMTNWLERSLKVIADVVGKIWAFPYTAVGLVIGVINLPFGGTVSLGNNAVQFHTTYGYVANGPGALTLGNVVLYSKDAQPISEWETADGKAKVLLGKHEEAHTYQYQVLGPFFVPTYLLGGGAFTMESPYEQAADRYALGLGSWWPWAAQ